MDPFLQAYEYEGKRFIGIRLRKFFGLGLGRLVSVAALQGLWRKRFDAADVKPGILRPSRVQEGATQPKLKRSHVHNLEYFTAKRRRVHMHEQREAEKAERELVAERERVEERTTFACEFASEGCRHRPFLSKHGAEAHSSVCKYSGNGDHQPNKCRVKLRVRTAARVHVSLQAQ